MHEIKEHLFYDRNTGEFTWLKPTSNRVRVGDTAGVLVKNKASLTEYVTLGYKSNKWLAHRLAWWWVYGVWPKDTLDHIDEVGHHNWISNLREISQAGNNQNISCTRANNAIGFTGVYWDTSKNKYRAEIRINKKRKYIGLFTTPEAAHEAYIKAKRELHPYWIEK
jgi:hypothetical protein